MNATGPSESVSPLFGAARPDTHEGASACLADSAGAPAAGGPNSGSVGIELGGRAAKRDPTPAGVTAPGAAAGECAVVAACQPPAGDGFHPVNRPRGYLSHPSGVECIDILEWLGGNLAQALQYVWRHLHKGRPDEDLEKAEWYIRREIKRRALLEGLYLPVTDPGLWERWQLVIRTERCARAAVVYRALMLAHFGPVYETSELDVALTQLGHMRAALPFKQFSVSHV